ncbi:cullin-5-like isoform X2 [Watersipora subatra]|uniref:cullin-5-like isoform X2 n=1 Tax=Watersipora subatra TaxID=2589382 RepID=UPI00355C1926
MALIRAYTNEWVKFFAQCSYLPQPFGSLERIFNGTTGSHTRNKKDILSVRTLMLASWNETIFTDLKQRLQEAAMHLIDLERHGEFFDSQLVIGVRESFVNLDSGLSQTNIYVEYFERAYIEATRQFYTPRAAEHLSTEGVRNYMRWAHTRLQEETSMANRYLDTAMGSASVNKLVDVCVKTLVVKYKDSILSECLDMIKANDIEQLKLMFQLMSRVDNGVALMLKDLEGYIKESGLADMHACAKTIVTDSEQYVEKLLSLFRRFTELVSEAFMMDPRFLTARDMAYKSLVNDTSVFRIELPTKARGPAKVQPESRCPELLATYCDLLLRKTPLSKKLSSDEIEHSLKNLLLVLKYVQNKDVFMRFHKAHLTRRLILGTSADNEVEEMMVDWLREIGMPADYVNKLARMFQDMQVSDDLNTEYRELARNNCENVNIKILNSGAWARSSEKTTVSLPADLEDVIPSVEEFYKRKHNGRKLQWNNLMSNGVVTFASEFGKYDLEVTTFQLAILCSWNNRPDDEISFESIRLATQLPESELRRTLWSLVAVPKLKNQVLQYRPTVSTPKDFMDTTMFFVNQQFSLIKNGKAQKRGRVNLIGRLQLSTEKSSEEDNEAIIQLRILRVQEAIVTIMKMRKKLSNAGLQTELVEMLKNMFLPSKKLIKEQLEWLIENKYIARDDNDINLFTYMA